MKSEGGWAPKDGVLGAAGVWKGKTCQVGMSNLLPSSSGLADMGNYKIVAESISMVIQFSQEFLAAWGEQESTQMAGLIW